MIFNTGVLNGNGWGWNMAEGFDSVPLPFPGALGTGDGRNALNGSFTLTTPLQLTASMDAHPYIKALVDATNGFTPPSSAEGSLAFVLTISDAAGNVVGEWAPTELNHAVTAFMGDTQIWDPNNLGEPTDPLSDNFANYVWANAPLLQAGNYSMALSMSEHASTRSVPEPGSIFLLGVGLGGLVYRRRKTAHGV